MKNKEIILSGMQPTGEIHLGNYFGALRNFVQLQEDYESYFFLATYHSLTVPYEVETKKKNILNLAKAYIACGLDPKKSVIFDQADVNGHLELAWIFNCLTPLAEAQRMTQFKDKSVKNSNNINIGLLSYPILQAADILIYKATTVPIGQDQIQHVELTRKIARWFNNRYGEYFQEPKVLLTSTPKIQSLIDPSKKMSKSDGPNAYIGIFDSPEIIEKKIKKAVTGTGTEKEITPGAANLLLILKELNKESIAKEFEKSILNGSVRYGDLKTEVSKAIIEHFTPMREKYESITDSQIKTILKDGAARANEKTSKTLNEIKKIIGVV